MSIRQRLYPESGDQTAMLDMHCSHARYVFNLGLEHRKQGYQHRNRYGSPTVTYVSQARELTEARAHAPWLRTGSTVVQQGALRDLDRAFRNFFAGRTRYPRFRSLRDTRQGFVVRDLFLRRYNRKWGAVQVPKAGWVRFRISRPWSEIQAATSARVTVERDRWHVSFTCPAPQRVSPGTGKVIGVDRGVVVTAATSEGSYCRSPVSPIPSGSTSCSWNASSPRLASLPVMCRCPGAGPRP